MSAVGPELPDRAEVVIVGGGIIGCSLAYHLTRRGITDVVVVEQGTLTCGTTWHAAGLVSQLKSSHSLTRLATYSARLFEELEDETGQATGYRRPGSISVAADEERWEEILRGASMATTCGVVTEVIDLDRAKELWPLLNTEDLVGALLIPDDGLASPVDTTMALAKGARMGGAKIFEETECDGGFIDPFTGLNHNRRVAQFDRNYQICNDVREFCNRTKKTIYISIHPQTEAARRVLDKLATVRKEIDQHTRKVTF